MPRTLIHLAFALILLAQLAIGLFGIDQPLRFGHQGHHVGEHGMGARNLAQWGEWTATVHHDLGPPRSEELNFHHPSMMQLQVFLAQAVFGEEDPWPVRATGLFYTLLALTALFLFANKARGPMTALVAAAVFVLDPLNISFCNLPDVQVKAISATFFEAWLLLLLFERPRLSVVFGVWLVAIWGGFADWVWYPVIFLMFLVAVWRARPYTRLRDAVGPRGLRLIRIAVAGLALITLMVFGQHFLRAYLAGRMDDLHSIYGSRTAGDIWQFLDPAWQRLRTQHTEILPFLAGAWLFLRFPFTTRNLGTWLLACVLVGQTAWMLWFKVEFLVHEYRSYWYVAPFAFCAADMAVGGMRAITRRLAHHARAIRAAIPALASLALILAMIPPAAAMAIESRQKAGSTDLDPYRANTHINVASQLIGRVSPPDAVVLIGREYDERPEIYYLVRRPSWYINSASDLDRVPDGRPYAVMLTQERLRRERSWQRRACEAQVVILENLALLFKWPDATPSIQEVRWVEGQEYGWVERYLRYPARGRVRLVPGDAANAAALARDLSCSERIVRNAESDSAPFLNQIGDVPL